MSYTVDTVIAEQVGHLDLCLDLGGDSLKIAYAYIDAKGDTAFGKVDTEGDLADVGVPAVALYDDGKWLYGDDIDAAGKTSFVNVVRIKDLLSLVCGDDANRHFYTDGNYFPKFYFPTRRGMNNDFSATVKADRAFEAPGFTPQTVCEQYFFHIKKLIDRRKVAICTEHLGMSGAPAADGVAFRVSIVYSPSADESYIEELSRIVKTVFGSSPYKSMSTTKALGMYAYTTKLLDRDEQMLLFDMGEETMSAAKSVVIKGQVTIEGEEGHNAPISIGGIDVDGALVDYIEKTIERRETPGTPSYGSAGHLSEEGMQSKQYLLMKELKQAKVLLGRSDGAFRNGVPISVWRELCISRVLTREELTECLGIDGDTGVAHEIVDYIVSEMKQPLNAGIKKIFLSGGIANTLGLRELIARELKANGFDVEFISIPGTTNAESELNIYPYEATAYAAAVGGAIVALMGCEVKATLSLSYGTFVYLNRKPPKMLKLFAERGTPLSDGRNDFWSDKDGKPTRLHSEDGEVFDEFYSSIITSEDIASGRFRAADSESKTGIMFKGAYPVIDEPYSAARRRAEKTILLKEVVSGGIVMMYRGERVTMDKASLLFREGISVDGRGRAKPIIENVTPGEIRDTMHFYRAGSSVPYRSEHVNIFAKDIELRFSGFDEFKVGRSK